jgi:glucose-6-phosphate isomerase
MAGAPGKAPAAKGGTDLRALEPVREGLEVLEGQDFSGRLWMKDGTLWNGDVTEIRNRLGWLTAPLIMREHADDLRSFADEIRRLQYSHVVLLGMGGSALAPEMYTATFGSKMGFPDLLVVDTTDPAAVRRVTERINPGRTMFVVSTKSGTTLETLDLYQIFRGVVESGLAPRPGSQFIAITDAGTPLEQLATEAAFRRTFLNPPTIGGRYSALSFFGLVPAALIGVDVKAILTRATAMMEACAAETAARDNPALLLGAALAGYAQRGRDKVTLVFSEKLRALGSWIEQLLAESLGKDGKGLVPVDAEPLGAPAVYGQDRLFVAVCLPGDTTHDAALAALEAAGHPVLRLAVADPQEIGAECFRWMLATAAAGALLGVNPFDEPDVAAAKERTAALLGDHRRTRRLPDWPLDVEQDGLAFSMGGGPAASDVAAGLWTHLTQAQPGDYLAIQAYLAPQAESWTQLQTLRALLRDRFRLATTVAWGPRYLHSTGQLHKGGPPSGLFLQVTGDDPEDVPVPGAGHGLATVKAAQALADAEALRGAGRRIARVHLRGKTPQALARLVKLARELSKSG